MTVECSKMASVLTDLFKKKIEKKLKTKNRKMTVLPKLYFFVSFLVQIGTVCGSKNVKSYRTYGTSGQPLLTQNRE